MNNAVRIKQDIDACSVRKDRIPADPRLKGGDIYFIGWNQYFPIIRIHDPESRIYLADETKKHLSNPPDPCVARL
jgi:hypothetical protein